MLGCAAGGSDLEVAAALGCNRNTVGRWRRRYLADRLDGLLDKPRPGRPRTISDAAVEEVIVRDAAEGRDALVDTLDGCARRPVTNSRFADLACVRAAAALRRQLEASKDPLFIDKVRDIVGLYLAPPERAVVLCVNEKSQIQALDRTQPILPMPGTPGQSDARLQTCRHLEPVCRARPDKRQGDRCAAPAPRALEFGKFLKRIDQHVPAELDVHLVLDNFSTHKTPQIQR